MSFCYMCSNSEMDSNSDSKEHVILQSFGGTLWGYGLLCKKHNNSLGNEIDSELFEQLGHYSDMFGINDSSKRKLLTGYTSDGEEYITTSGMKGGFVVILKYEEREIKVKGLTKDEVIKKAKKVIKSHHKKEDLDEIFASLESSVFEDSFPKDKLIWFKNSLTEDPRRQRFILNPLMIKAFTKIALNYYFLNSYSKDYVEELIHLMKKPLESISPNPQIIRMVNQSVVKREAIDDDISHVLFIKGDQVTKCLTCFIELFSFFRILVFMNMVYEGPSISVKWGFNLLKKQTFEPNIELIPNKSNLLDLQFNNDAEGMLSENYERIISVFNEFKSKGKTD